MRPRDAYAETQREALLLECEGLLSEQDYAAPLAELHRQLLALLVPASLRPDDPQNVVLELERAFAEGVAELEAAGHWREGMSVYDYVARLLRLEKRPAQ